MYKSTISAATIIEQQNPDGSWGVFHTLSEPTKNPITTEQALRRLEVLGFSIKDECIARAVGYMQDCLWGNMEIPDAKEKTHDNKIFRDLMLSTWIRKFTKEDEVANGIALAWSQVISYAFRSGQYLHEDYLAAYEKTFHKKVKGDRFSNFVNYYQVSLTSDMFDKETEELVFDHILNNVGGIYYIGYRKKLKELPDSFTSKQAIKFMASMELLASYKCASKKLSYVRDWLDDNKTQDNLWDFGGKSKDNIYLPLSDSWRKKLLRLEDSTYFVEKVLRKIIEDNYTDQ